jgi:uncharacterized protein YkwD
MMRTLISLICVIVVALATAGCLSAPARQVSPGGSTKSLPPAKKAARLDPNLETIQLEIIEAHNKVRSEAKLPSLTSNSKLQAAAEAHALDMAIHKKMSHTGSNGSSSIDRIKATGFNYRRAGENVAFGRFTTEAVMKGWLNSPPHKRNIVGGFSQIGVGCAIAEDGKRYWCVTFGLPMRR